MTFKRIALACLLVALAIASFLWFRKDEDDPRPLFANRKVASAEFGGRSGWYNDFLILEDGTHIQYDDQENMLVAGKAISKSDLLLMPGPKGDGLVAGICRLGTGKSVNLPRWKNSAIFFNDNGVVRVIFLQNAKAKDLYNAIEKNHAQFDKIFGAGTPPVL